MRMIRRQINEKGYKTMTKEDHIMRAIDLIEQNTGHMSAKLHLFINATLKHALESTYGTYYDDDPMTKYYADGHNDGYAEGVVYVIKTILEEHSKPDPVAELTALNVDEELEELKKLKEIGGKAHLDVAPEPADIESEDYTW